ncbi:MAG: FAD/NAD(P)-binding protein [Myxococcota bacterium]|nr:FAD/NAD(P)-binding protein [Myxococcota bacterium]
MPAPTPPQADLIIIGGGASGTALVRALAASRQAGAPALRVALVERTASLGPGLPYTETADAFHTMGRTATLRRDKGLQLERRFTAAAARLRETGAVLDLHTTTEATALRRDGDGWEVDVAGGPLKAPRVVIATGHWHVARLAHLRRWVDWRWDVRALHAAISDQEDVVVLGMGQSGLDAALSLAERRRHLPRPGRIQLVSRTGLLPSVFGQVATASAPLATRNLESLLRSSNVRLTDIVAAVRADTLAVAGPRARLPDWDLPAVRAHAATADPLRLFREELAAAQASRVAREEIPWHPVLWHGMHFFHPLMARLSAEDRLLLADWWTPVMRHLEAIHVGAASRLLELIDAGRISLTGLGDSLSLGEDSTEVWVRGPRGEARGQRLLDTRGPDPRLALCDDRFLHSVLATGAAAAGRAPFVEGPAPRSVPDGWSVEHRGGADWLITGGLWVDPETFAVRDAERRSHGLYTLGPLTLGQFPFYAGLWATGRAAERIVASLD